MLLVGRTRENGLAVQQRPEARKRISKTTHRPSVALQC
jgi:hypothetical protein